MPASHMKEKLQKLENECLASFENVRSGCMKRALYQMPSTSQLDRGNNSKVKTEDNTQIFNSNSKFKNSDSKSGLGVESAKKMTKLQQEQSQLQLLKSISNQSHVISPQNKFYPSCSDSSREFKSTNRPSKSDSHELKHISMVVDKLDLCDCPNHTRMSLSLCRKSKRRSSPLQAVNERDDSEEDSICDSEYIHSSKFDEERPTRSAPFDIEIRHKQN